jgi:hypothetical protein
MLSMNATMYLNNEDSYVAWLAAEDAFTYISHMLALTDNYDAFKVEF